MGPADEQHPVVCPSLPCSEAAAPPAPLSSHTQSELCSHGPKTVVWDLRTSLGVAMSCPQAPFRNYTRMEEACSAQAGPTPPGRWAQTCRAWRNSCWGSCISTSWWAKVMRDPLGCPSVAPTSLLQPWGHVPKSPGNPEGQLLWVLHNHTWSPAHGILSLP